MTHSQFFKHFDLLADQPDAVAKMRELVLQLAVRGQLVEQNSKDEPAQKLVERARRAWSDRKIRDREKSEPQEPPHTLPAAWAWTCLDEIGDTNPRNEADDKLEVGFAPMKLIQAGYGEEVSFEIQRWGEIKRGFTHFADGDVVLAKITPCFENGKSAVIRDAKNGIGAGTTELHVFRQYSGCVLSDYVLIFLKSPRFVSEGVQRMTGSAGQKRVPWDYFANTPFPLPPMAEQRRIVAKVDELMALCDELGTRQQARHAARAQLTQSAYHHLTNAKDPADFRCRFNFIFQHSSFILEDVPQLRQAILQLAVQGRLVPQNPKDGAGHAVTAQISKQRGMKCADTSGEFTSIPKSWAAVSVEDIFEVAGGIQKTPQRVPRNNAFPYLRVANVQRGRLVLDDVQQFELGEGELERWRLEPNDLLVVEGNGSEDEIGRCAQWHGEISDCVHQNHIIRCRPIGHDARFVILFFNSPAGIEEMKRRAITTSGLYSLSVGKIRSLPIPFPPLAEQKRIVARVEALLRQCDTLEAQLRQTRTLGAHLLDSTLHHLLTA